MSYYHADRAFTDFVHQQLALPIIYKKLDWDPVVLDAATAFELDIKQGIDYTFHNGQKIVTVQERFREIKYQQYGDFTIRYRRDNNIDTSRHPSEYYKMKADYFVYGITNGYKNDLSKVSSFVKYAVIDLHRIYQKIDEGMILIDMNGGNTCTVYNGQIICPLKHNTDGSSSFFPIDIAYVVQLWGDEIIIAEKGFL